MGYKAALDSMHEIFHLSLKLPYLQMINYMLRFVFALAILFCSVHSNAQNYSFEQLLSYPFPTELTASPVKDRLAWAVNLRGERNVFVSQSSEFSPRPITSYYEDDGQEITSLQFSPDGEWLVYVRGGEHGSNWDGQSGVNPTHLAVIPKVEIWKSNFDGKDSKRLAEGDYPTISPDGKHIAFVRSGTIWRVSPDEGRPEMLVEVRGGVSDLSWSPDGSKLLFITQRNTHSLVTYYDFFSEDLVYLAPSFSRDMMPRWSLQGDKVAFVRRLGGSGEAKPLLEQYPVPWEIWVAEIETGDGVAMWQSRGTLRGSYPSTHGGANLNWTAKGELVFLSYEDGWPHIYHLTESGLTQLTKGNYMAEHIQVDGTGSTLLFSANHGDTLEDIDRKHLGMIDLETGKLNWLTSGSGIETFPVMLSSRQQVAYLGSNAQQPLLPVVVDVKTGNTSIFGKSLLPPDFPAKELVTPRQVTFQAEDGVVVHAQLFEKNDGVGDKPAIVFVHGGPQRQMLLGWHYGDYYANTYAVNQFLAAKGFVVLSVNFRLGIGYGYEFHKPGNTYWQGAAEYRDIKAAGEYLKNLEQIDRERIGIYGGSYGGYLMALALARDSELFKVGVDIHGVHELSSRLEMPEGYEKAPDFEQALQTAWESSPLADLESWSSPVLFIHGDNDRNVQVVQTVDLVRRFQEMGKPFEYLLIPDDTHHWMRFGNQLKVGQATVDFLMKHLSEN